MDCTMQEAIDIIASDSAIGEIVDERLAQASAYPREALVSLKKQEVSSALRLSVSPNSWLVGTLKTLTQQDGSFAYPPPRSSPPLWAAAKTSSKRRSITWTRCRSKIATRLPYPSPGSCLS